MVMFSFQIFTVATVGIHERERLEHLVGPPGLDPGTLRLRVTRPTTSRCIRAARWRRSSRLHFWRQLRRESWPPWPSAALV